MVNWICWQVFVSQDCFKTWLVTISVVTITGKHCTDIMALLGKKLPFFDMNHKSKGLSRCLEETETPTFHNAQLRSSWNTVRNIKLWIWRAQGSDTTKDIKWYFSDSFENQCGKCWLSERKKEINCVIALAESILADTCQFKMKSIYLISIVSMTPYSSLSPHL